ncbi:MAG: hypothetical protein ABR564_07210, partial [Candidatus Dormibacteria bacterium]
RPPRTLFPWCHQRLHDAIARDRGARPVHRVQAVTIRHVLTFGSSWIGAVLDRLRRAHRHLDDR